MKTIPRVALLLALAMQAAMAVAADDRPVDERRPLKPDARVSVSNVAGRIEVEAWDRNELHVTGTLSDDVEELEIEGGESSMRIEVRVAEHTRNVGPTILKLKVPAGASLEAEAVSADVAVKGLRGAVEVEAVSGDVTLDVASKRIEAGSVSGDVSLTGPAEETRVQSVSGNVTVRGASGELRGESVSGDVRVQARAVRVLDVETVSGDLLLDLELAKDAEVSVETLSGEVELALPALPDGSLEMETFSGDLESAFSPGPSSRAKEYAHEGKGRGRVRLSSFSGDIKLKKK